jgi:hypothetical protein
MKKFKYLTLSLITSGSLFFLFSPEVIPDNFQFEEFLNSSSQNDVVIIFNSGGWGNTPLEEAEDFAPIVEGIQETLNERGLNSIVVPYQRTKDNLLGKITGIKEGFHSFQNQAGELAGDINEFLKQNPNQKIIIAGLSNGAAFVDETMEKLTQETEKSVCAIEAGVPFWEELFDSENILRLDNGGKDTLAKGEVKSLISSLVKAPFKWILAKISGENLSFSQAINVSGHEYFWDSPLVSSQIVTFLNDKVR